jgi:hypothetical protein
MALFSSSSTRTFAAACKLSLTSFVVTLAASRALRCLAIRFSTRWARNQTLVCQHWPKSPREPHNRSRQVFEVGEAFARQFTFVTTTRAYKTCDAPPTVSATPMSEGCREVRFAAPNPRHAIKRNVPEGFRRLVVRAPVTACGLASVGGGSDRDR